MDTPELLELLSPTGLDLLDSLPTYDSGADVLAQVAALRKQGHSPALVAAVMSQAKLRGKARAKFGEFASRMLFTEAGLEQATRLSVASRHAGRYRAAGLTRVADLGCGIGGDALAFAGLDLEVLAVDRDEVTAAIASFNLAPFASSRVVQGDAASVDLSGVEAVFLDPARRTTGHGATRRIADPADWSPGLDVAFGLADRLPTGVKFGPGIDRELLPADAECQWVSVDRDVVEVGVWFGPLAREGVRRSALMISASSVHEMVAPADSEDVDAGDLGRYLYEPDGAVIRARLIGDLARTIDARMISRDIAYLTTDERVDTPFAQGFEITAVLPLDEKTLKRELKSRGIGRLEIKKRGVDVDPAAFRKRLSLQGEGTATLVLTRVAGRHTALLCERL